MSTECEAIACATDVVAAAQSELVAVAEALEPLPGDAKAPPIMACEGTAAGPAVTTSIQPAVTVSENTATPTLVASTRVMATTTVTAGTPARPTTTKSKKKKGQASASLANASSGAPGAQGENTGRWTAEEHRLFLQGLEQHGKGWKKIASLIKSRTVVQIRTHAQKYFQKLAKARQNGEEGDVTMDGRGGVASVTSVSTETVAQTNKRRRQITGTKRKAIQSVVASAQRQAKKLAMAAGVPNPIASVPGIAPALAHFVLPNALHHSGSSCVPSITACQGNISGPALEDSIFRFLTPVPVAPPETQMNDVVRQAGANPITLPTSNPSTAPTITSGEVSPTGVQELSIYPSWTDVKDPPSWYSKGADVDALLDVADTLDWLTDTGDLNDSYQPPVVETDTSSYDDSHTAVIKTEEPVHTSTSVNTLPHIDSNMESVVPPLPSLFDSHPDATVEDHIPKNAGVHIHHEVLHHSSDEPDIDHLEVFDTPLEEQDFVSTILETAGESTDHLPGLS